MNSDLANLPVESTIDAPSCDNSGQTVAARRYRFGCWLVIEAEGEVDMACVPRLRRLLESDSSHVVFDLSRVTFIDASGLGFLAETQHRVSQAHGAVRVAGPSQQTRKLLTLTTLDEHIAVFESLDQAFTGHGPCW